ncbi:hypothetical protein ACHAPT_000159 [Fusarium lateritium]
MSGSKRPISIDEELRDHIEGHLDDLIKSGQVQLPPGKRIRLNQEGIPKLIEDPLPAISTRRITQVFNHICDNLFSRSSEWYTFFFELQDLRTDEAGCANFTHNQILEHINVTQELVEKDFDDLTSAAKFLRESPEQIYSVMYPNFLPHLVAPMLGRKAGRSPDEDEGDKSLDKLERSHHGFFLLVHQICQIHRCAKASPEHSRLFGRRAAHCFDMLEAALESKNPRNDMEHEVFRSLRERVDEISKGNREASPEVEDEVKGGTEDDTGDDTGDDTED